MVVGIMYKNQTSSAIKMKNQTMTNQTMTIRLSLNPSTRPLGRRPSLSKITPPPPPPPSDFSDGEQYQRYCWYQSESSPVTRSSEHHLHPPLSSSVIPAHAGMWPVRVTNDVIFVVIPAHAGMWIHRIQNIQFRSPSRRSHHTCVQRVDSPVSPHRSKTAQRSETTQILGKVVSESADKRKSDDVS